MKEQTQYWIAVVSKNHLMRGVNGGFMQANHGKEAPLKKLDRDDWVLFYSPKETFEGKDLLQAFTAIGQVADDKIYQHTMTGDFIPYRRDMVFYKCEEIPIAPLIDQLDFIENKKSWGFKFRFGFFEIPEQDFKLISSAMIKDKHVKIT
ncbi:MAG: EVE domain-containing protein [Pedobacter sp.]|nr:MAG: EVE domain-containing protein [Pedobacter sp.]